MIAHVCLAVLAAMLVGCATAEAADSVAVAFASIVAVAPAVLLARYLVRRARETRRVDASDNQEIARLGEEVYTVPHMTYLEAKAMANAIEAKARKARAPAALLLAACLSGCAPGVLGAKQTLANAQTVGAEVLRQWKSADATFQDKLVADARAAGTTEAARVKFATYQTARDKALVAEASFNAAVTAAVIGIRAAESGGKVDFVALANAAFKAALELKAVIEAFLAPGMPPAPSGWMWLQSTPYPSLVAVN